MRDLQRKGVQDLMEQGAQIVEVLPRSQFEEEHLPGAVNIELRNIETEGPKKLDKREPVVVYCWDST